MSLEFFCIIVPIVATIGFYIGYLQGRVNTLNKEVKLLKQERDYYSNLIIKSNAQETCPKYLKEYKGE